MTDTTLTSMLKGAEQRDRIITPNTCKLPLDGTYANDASTTAILGEKQLANDVHAWLHIRGYTTGYNWLLSEQDLDKLSVNDQFAELRRVGVGGVVINNMNDLGAGDRCGGSGWARGVRENSTGNRGGC